MNHSFSKYSLLFLLIISNFYSFAQPPQKYPDINHKYTKQEVEHFLDYYQQKRDTLGIVYASLLWQSVSSSKNFDEEKKIVSILFRYKYLVKKHSEENYYHLLLELASHHSNDYKSLMISNALCDSVFRYSQSTKNTLLHQKAISYQAYLLLEMGDKEQVFNILKQLYQYKHKWQKEPALKIEYYYQLGNAYLLANRYNESIDCFRRVNELTQEGNYKRVRHLTVLFLAQCFRKIGQYSKAEDYALLGLDMTKGIDNIYLERWALEELALVNHQKKMYKIEAKYWIKYWEIEQEIRKLNQKKLNNTGINLELLEAELKQANIQKQLIENESNQKKRITNSLMIICMLLVLLLGVGIWVYRQRVKIAEQQRQMALYQGQEQEKSLIARELHDNIGNTLAGIKTQIDPSTPNFHLLTTHLDDLYQNIRTLSHTLHVEDIEQVGLLQSSQDFIRLIDKNGLISFAVYGQEVPLLPLQSKILYRVIQELLTNALKHAQATKITLSLLFDEKKLLMSVEDNGVGFQPSQNARGIGLKNVQKRVEVLKGNIQWHTSSEGSSFLIEIPF
jgi:signal transduction histidine kinase